MNREYKYAILLIGIFLCSNMQIVLGAQLFDEELEINADWFHVNGSSFNGNPLSGDRYKTLNVDTGAVGMKKFINHGQVGYDSENNTYVYLAEMIFPFTAAFYTNARINDVFSYDVKDRRKAWLKLRTYDHWNDGNPDGSDTTNYYNLKYTDIEINDFDENFYDGDVQINTEVTPNLPFSKGDTVKIGDSTFEIPDWDIGVSKIKLTDSEYGMCNAPENSYVSEIGADDNVKSEYVSKDISGNSKSSPRDKCGDGLHSDHGVPYSGNSLEANEIINRNGLEDTKTYRDVTYVDSDVLGDSFASVPTVGKEWGTGNNLVDESNKFNFNFPIRIKPEATVDRQYIEYGYTSIEVDTYDEGGIWYDYGLTRVHDENSKSERRNIGLNVRNTYALTDLEASVSVLLNVKPSGEESNATMDKPEMHSGDVVWDDIIYGDADVQTTVTKPHTFWNDLEYNWKTFWHDVGNWFEDVGTFFTDAIEGVGEWFDAGGWIWIVLIGVAVFAGIMLIFKIKKQPVDLANKLRKNK